MQSSPFWHHFSIDPCIVWYHTDSYLITFVSLSPFINVSIFQLQVCFSYLIGSHSPFTISIFQLQVLKDATVLPVTAHQVPFHTKWYTNTKYKCQNTKVYTQKNYTNTQPTKHVSIPTNIQKKLLWHLLEHFFLETAVWKIKWWKDLVSNINEFILSKQGFSITQCHISLDWKSYSMKTSIWGDL